MESIVVAHPTNAVDAENNKLAGGNIVTQKKNRIQVSNTKKPLLFYLNLAKRYIKQHNDVELSALGMAIPTVVTIAEVLKSNGLAIEKKVATSTVGSKEDAKGRLVQKAKIEIVLEKTQKNDKKTPAATETKAAETPTAMETKDADTPAAMETKAAETPATETKAADTPAAMETKAADKE